MEVLAPIGLNELAVQEFEEYFQAPLVNAVRGHWILRIGVVVPGSQVLGGIVEPLESGWNSILQVFVGSGRHDH